MRISMSGKVALGSLLSAVAGCGGGHGGYGSSSMPAPTVTFSQPAADTVNFGQAVTVTWTSAYATACTASASSAAAGAFTGSQMPSGTLNVVPTAAGSYTYSLSCTGSGGT